MTDHLEYAKATADKRFNFTVDWLSLVLGGLFIAFQASVLYLVHPAVSTSGSVSSGAATQSSSPAMGGSLLLVAAIEILFILLLWRVYKRLPERWQQVIKRGLKLLFYPILYLAQLFGTYKWLALNMFAFGMGVIVTAVISLTFAPKIVVGILVVATIYDHVAVNLSDVMGDLVAFSSAARLPNYILIPNQLDVNLDGLRAYIRGETDEKPESIAFIIGVGDFVFPTALVGSVYIAVGFSPAVMGAMAGTVVASLVLRDAIEDAEEGLPALPWVNSGAIAGFIVGGLVMLL